MEERVIRGYYDEFLNGKTQVIQPVWLGIKGATIINRLYDPTKALTKDDFNQSGLLGTYEAFKRFDDQKNMSLRTWSIKISNQFLIRTLINVNPHFVSLSKLVTDEKPAEFFYLKLTSNYEPSFISEEYYQKIINYVTNILYQKNRKILDLFRFKLENPDVDASGAMNMLGISSVYYTYLKEIKLAIQEAVNAL